MNAMNSESQRLNDRCGSGRSLPRKRAALLASVILGLSVPGIGLAGPLDLFGPKGDSAKEKRETILKQRDEVLKEFFDAKPEMKDHLEKAVGYAVFKQTDVNLLLLASSNGYGVLVDNKANKKETYMRVAALGGGAGMGVKDLRVIFIFNDATVMQKFMDEGWQFSAKADASAKAGDQGASAEQAVKSNVDFTEGTTTTAASSDARAGNGEDDTKSASASSSGPMEIYQFTENGISLQATVSGTKYWKDSDLNK